MKKVSFFSKLKSIHLRKIIIFLFILGIAFLLPLIFCKLKLFSESDEATVGLFSVIAAALGAMFVVIQLNGSERINRCDMLLNLN